MPTEGRLIWAAATRSGSRKEINDDSWIVFSADAAGSETHGESGNCALKDRDLVCAVSDGMGGAKAGDLASALILKRMAEIIPETFKAAASGFFPDSLSHLEEAIRGVHEDVNKAAMEDVSRKGMAATLAIAWFSPENMYLANVGDSRIYFCRAGKAEQLTKDHTHAWGQFARGQIKEFEFRSHPRRAALYEVVGGGRQKISPHFAAVSYQPGDRFLICSDGLIDGVWNRHIGDALGQEDTPEGCRDRLLTRAISNSGVDDTTLIVIHVAD